MNFFSVIIPTLQRSAELNQLVDQCVAHPRVQEVIVINNAPTPLAWTSPKVRVLQQEKNIFVNPAWNLGVEAANGEYVAIVNDDVLFSDEVFDYAARLLRLPFVGMVGPDGAFMNRPAVALSHRIASEGHITLGMGVFMAMRRKDYLPIPDTMKIWGGDDWLYWTQRMPSRVLLGGDFRTDMSTTSGAVEFSPRRESDLQATQQALASVKGGRWWHAPIEGLARLRRVKGRLTHYRA